MTYKLELTDADVETIAFVGGRYCWSEALLAYDAGTHDLTEPEAWAITAAIDADQDGGHDPLPMLAVGCELAEKLHELRASIV